MAIEITIPRLGWNMEEGTFVGWLKSDGQHVAAGEPLFNLEGDKATQDIESLETGILRIPPDGPKEGDKVAVGTVIGYLVGPASRHPLHAGSRRPIRSPIPNPASRRRPERSGSRLTLAVPRSFEAANLAARRRVARELAIDATGLVGQRKDRPHSRARRPRRGTSAGATPAGRTRPGSGDARDPDRSRGIPRVPSARFARRSPSGCSRARDHGRRDDHDDGRRDQPRQPAAAIQGRGRDGRGPTIGLHRHRRQADGPGAGETSAAECPLERRQDPGFGGTIHIGIAVDTEAGLLVPVILEVRRLTLRQLAAQSRYLIDRARQGTLTRRRNAGEHVHGHQPGPMGIECSLR